MISQKNTYKKVKLIPNKKSSKCSFPNISK